MGGEDQALKSGNSIPLTHCLRNIIIQVKGLEKKWGFGWYQKGIGHYYWHGLQRRKYWHGWQKKEKKQNVAREAITPPI